MRCGCGDELRKIFDEKFSFLQAAARIELQDQIDSATKEIRDGRSIRANMQREINDLRNELKAIKEEKENPDDGQ